MNLDTAKIYVKGGKGGDGCISFRREKHIPRGGPNGGDGGNGGSIVLQATKEMTTLIDLRYRPHQTADDGQHGMGKLRNGGSAEDRVVRVPVGTVVRIHNTDEIISDLETAGQSFIAAQGGIGGRGNAHFRSSIFQTPRVAEKGEPGEERTIDLEVKLIADVGLVGFPNAGKSTLLSRTSAAKPKIAAYPFTTLTPNLGVVRIAEDKNFLLADIPGLIDGAHTGSGLGHDFLRHIERTKILIHVIDASASDGRDPIEDFEQINRELSLYNKRLARIPQLVALNKTDLPFAQDYLQKVLSYFGKRKVYEISALTGQGVNALITSTYRLLQRINKEIQQKNSQQTPMVISESRLKEKIKVTQGKNYFSVEGKAVRRAALMTDFGNEQAIVMFYRKLKKMGVINVLIKAGIQEGDTVQIDEFEFTFDQNSNG
ncbi:TPA: GTPase ObgE [Candidatus Poribacteria bacterium]|nr:GTPase ObgE [Candidatus Poribacteria bacterium]HIA66459.1 GTPase ObgE [Candidatus Poribacteria bacterium]HIB90021.1 GTPase ObgE [Candidatus Poribacteria bacterium]HIC03020.1 GTPase ObgE [Candidatus Poribacteria bacterium]HIO47789.1 GTPase ObgE [Candidatus Poribacteria bacterium]